MCRTCESRAQIDVSCGGKHSVDLGNMDVDVRECDGHIPFPLDHFFFCFLPPVAAGA